MAMASPKVNTRFVTGLQKPKPLKQMVHNSAPDMPSKCSVLACLEEAIATMEKLVKCIINRSFIDYTLCLLVVAKLRANSTQLEELFKGQLDRAFYYFRSACIDVSMDLGVRMQLGFLIELRAMGWIASPSLNAYYTSKMPLHEPTMIVGEGGGGGEAGVLGPGEVIRTSGKYPAPTKMPSKNYYKDEVVIKNQDSGKVMGIKGRRVHMIEELSETVISFQRVNPGAKERLVQITGPKEEKIELAKMLIEDTIKRNSSPVRESIIVNTPGEHPRGGSNSSLNSSASDDSTRMNTGSRAALRKSLSLSEHRPISYKHTVDVGEETISISCHNLDILTVAMIVLDKHFNREKQDLAIQSGNTTEKIKDSGEFIDDSGDTTTISREKLMNGKQPPPIREVVLMGYTNPEPHQDFASGQTTHTRPKRLYTRTFLLDIAVSRACFMPPKNWEKISKEYPGIVKQVVTYFDAAAYEKKWLENEGKPVNILSATDELDSE